MKQKKNPVSHKLLATESTYGYLNIHLELLQKALKENNVEEMLFQKQQIEKCRKILFNLGYFDKDDKIYISFNLN